MENKREMDIRDFNPCVRFCSAVNLSSSYSEMLTAYDHRIFFVLEGGFTAHFENESILVRENGLLLFPPATPYRLEPFDGGCSKHIIVNFDMVSENRGMPSRTPVGASVFDRERVYSYKTFPPFDTVFYLENAYFCAEVLNEACEEMRNGDEGYGEILSGLLKCLLIRAEREKRRREAVTGNDAVALCYKVKEYLKSVYADGIDNSAIGERFGYHPYYLNQVFKKNTGYTLREYVTECRLSMARDLLLRTEKSIAEVGEICGFCSPAYFTETFSKRVGVTPREYRKKAK